MVDLLRVNRVQYVWNEETGDRLPLCYLYFCKYCLDIRSSDNLLHEVDSHYCPQTQDAVSTTEAAAKKNKSATSWQCPACPNLLTTKGSTITLPDPDDPSKKTVKKTHQLHCTFCRWSTRDVGIEDKATTTGGWMEREIPNFERIHEVFDYYKRIAQKEITDAKNSKKKGNKTLAMQLQHKYSSTKSYGRKPHPASPLNAVVSHTKEFQDAKEIDLAPSPALSLQDVEAISEDVYSKEIDFSKLSSISQRLSQPEHQTVDMSDFMPKKAIMFVKRSLRCKECQHNLIKPEYHPTSIKFKMELVAIQYVPEIRILKQPVLKSGERTRVTLVAINRTDHTSHVTLSRMHQENLNYPTARSPSELPSNVLVIPVSQFHVPEFGMNDDDNRTADNSNEIAFRDGNKVGFYVWVTPDETLNDGDDVWISFNMKYDYHSTMALLLQSKNDDKPAEPDVNWLCHRIFVNLGKLDTVN